MNVPTIPQLASNFLAVIYTWTKGQSSVPVEIRTLRSTCMTNDTMAAAAGQYLVNEGFAFWSKIEGELAISVTDLGYAFIQRQADNQPDTRLPPPTTYNISNSTVGGIQHGTSESAQRVEQDNSFNAVEMTLIRGFVAEARTNLGTLDESARREAEENLATLEEEAARDRPSMAVIRRAFETLRQIGYGVVGSGTWEALRPLLDRLA